MKKLIYTFLVVSIIFAACKKDDNTPTAAIQGCMDPLATNYVDNATADCTGNTGGPDVSCCTYVVSGCTDSIATNYNAAATVDDGSCEYGIVGTWTPTSVDLDSSMTTTINGEVVYELNGEILTYSGSQTMTPEEADIEGDIEFTSDEKMYIDGELIGDYTYSDNVLIIDDGYEIQAMGCTFTSTDLTITMEQSMDTAWVEPGFGDISISAYYGMTINCSINTAVNTNANQRAGNTDYSWFLKPKFNTAKLINSIKQK